jgi:hypothetical protein
MYAFIYGQTDVIFSKNLELISLENSLAIIFGAFLSFFDNWKQGKAKSPQIFSGGISIRSIISSKEMFVFCLIISAKRFLYFSNIFKNYILMIKL